MKKERTLEEVLKLMAFENDCGNWVVMDVLGGVVGSVKGGVGGQVWGSVEGHIGGSVEGGGGDVLGDVGGDVLVRSLRVLILAPGGAAPLRSALSGRA